jgi:ABC-type glycerol-3-phosphate transport system substrate-binding protein
MRRALILSLALSLAACGGGDESKVTETRMDDIDSLQGTISDEMVNTDELNEQAMVEAAPAATAKPKAKVDGDAKVDAKPVAEPKIEAPATAGDE